MVIATIFSLAYSLRFVYRIFIAPPKAGTSTETIEKQKLVIPNSMKLSLLILIVFVVILGVYPGFFINLITTVGFI
jgi:NADH:ubiquinone oxidoreductase subunit 5 (subunit L)/multisubunit Na+/H+ antiporter MnhA subunit